jgi:hypothetical protein
MDIDNSLSSLSCDAAIELDNLIRGKGCDLGIVKRLGEVLLEISRELSKGIIQGPSPMTAVALNLAISDSGFATAQIDVAGLAKEVGKVGRMLADDISSAEQLKSFCLCLSKRAGMSIWAITALCDRS